jgi:predicted  nucleic acid-binding Zn-ribbon protein
VLARDELTRHLAELRSTEHEAQLRQSELQSLSDRLGATLNAQADLASRLLSYVSGSDCPLCGHRYPSESELRSAISQRSQEIPQELTAVNAQLREATDRVVSVQSSIRAAEPELERVRSTIHSYEEEETALRSSAEAVESKAAALGLSADIETVDSAVRQVTAQLVEHETRSQASRQKMDELGEEIAALKDRIAALLQTLDEMNGRRRNLTGQLSSLEVRLTSAGERIGPGPRLEEISAEISTSRKRLIELVESQRGTNDRRASCLADLEAVRARKERTGLALRDHRAALVDLATEIDDFARRAASIDLTPEYSPSRIGEVRTSVTSEITSLRQLLEKLVQLGQTLNDLNAERQSLIEHLSSVEMKLTNAGERADRGPRREDILPQISASRERLVALMESQKRVSNRRASCLTDLQALRVSKERTESSLRDQQAALVDLAAQIEDFTRRARAMDLAPDCSPSQVRETRAALGSEIGALHSLLEAIEQYQRRQRISWLDSERKQLQEQLQPIKAAMSETRNQHSALLRVKHEAQAWAENLSTEVDAVVEERIRQHQREIVRQFKTMLPCPYMFDSVAMSRGSAGIELGLQFRGQGRPSGEPRFFLSNAQANVLALAIFLSFARRQKWSRLRTLLLDDPVQHLDDLDAAAFLDNIRALALGYSGENAQVILSTCDLDLYLLMVKKFGTLKQQGIRFRGISLIDSGPGGPRVQYDVDTAVEEPSYELAAQQG